MTRPELVNQLLREFTALRPVGNGSDVRLYLGEDRVLVVKNGKAPSPTDAVVQFDKADFLRGEQLPKGVHYATAEERAKDHLGEIEAVFNGAADEALVIARRAVQHALGTGMQLERRLARVCWNSRNWVAPTGEAARFESPGSYCRDYGFGHEEWLFNASWVVDGWRYGYVQALRKQPKSLPSVIDLYLFAIDGRGARRAVGVIRRCEVISRDEAAHALSAYRRNGWLKLMCDQVELVGGNTSMIEDANPEELFDLRFRPENVEVLSPPPVIEDPDFIRKYLRASKLYIAREEMLSAFRGTPATARQPRKKLVRSNTAVKAGWEGGAVELLHNQLQAELYDLLVARYGEGVVWAELDRVDLTLQLPDRRVLIELKTYPDVRYSIREALGQLLEYGYLQEPDGEIELVIVSPAPLTEDWTAYLTRLRERFAIPVSYRRFVSGQQHFEL